jgi:hypothetical protein
LMSIPSSLMEKNSSKLEINLRRSLQCVGDVQGNGISETGALFVGLEKRKSRDCPDSGGRSERWSAMRPADAGGLRLLECDATKGRSRPASALHVSPKRPFTGVGDAAPSLCSPARESPGRRARRRHRPTDGPMRTYWIAMSNGLFRPLPVLTQPLS